MKNKFLTIGITAVTLAVNAQSQFKLQPPSGVDALQKLKISENYIRALKNAGLKPTDVTITFKKQEVVELSSDEICYKIYKDSKRLEGANYVFDYEIASKPDNSGNKQITKAHVWYTRVEITETTCHIKNNWTYEFSTVDKFGISSKNGLLTVKEAEQLIMDTINKGYKIDRLSEFEENYADIETRKWETCRVDELKTCEFGKSGCSDYYEVKNIMDGQSHSICFETDIYRGSYETGPAMYASMYKVTKFKSLVCCEFQKKGGRAFISKIHIFRKNSEDVVNPGSDRDKPLELYYTPLSKTKIEKIRGRFIEGKAAPNSILYYRDRFKEMANDFNTSLNKDYDNNLKVFSNYFAPESAKKYAENYTEGQKGGTKYFDWAVTIDDADFTVSIKCKRKSKKFGLSEAKTDFGYSQKVYKDGKYYLNSGYINL